MHFETHDRKLSWKLCLHRCRYVADTLYCFVRRCSMESPSHSTALLRHVQGFHRIASMMVAEFEQHAPKLLRKLQVGHRMASLELRTFDLSFLTILQGMLLCEHWFLHICKMRKVSYRFIEYTRNYTCDLCDYMWLHYIALQHAALSGDPPLLQISGLPLTVAFHLTYPYLPLPAFRSSPVQCFSFWSSQLIVMSLCNLRNFRITYIVQKYSRTSYIVLYKSTQ
jgi:hypothetical protein